VRRSGRNEFTHSARAELFAYRKRKAGRIHLHLEVDAQSKKRLNTESLDGNFVAEVAKALEEQGRHAPFRVPVAIRMHFHVGLERTPPQIHQLPKHYLDLLQTPIAARPPDRRPLLLQDDRLVEALFCSYSFADEEPSAPFMTFEVTTLTSFIRDLELHRRIATGDFDDVDGVRELAIKHPYGLGDYEDELGDDSIDEYRRLVRMGESGRKQYGEKLYDALLLMNKHAAQRELLKRRELRPVDVGTLYGPMPRRRRHDELFRPISEASAATIKQISALGVACADLGPPAAQTGDSEILKGKVRAALENMRDHYPILNPLFTTVGVTLLYVRPLKAQAIDLDNLARRFVVPIVHEELKPPATSLHAIEHLKPDGDKDEWVREGLERLRRAHKHQITRYQVFSLPRIEDDPPEGKISVLIHGGDEIEERWSAYRDELDAWESVVARSAI
jgi:hypothetical protein